MIDRATVDRIINAAQIEEVVSDFVTLRKRGVNYVGLCPFHDDKTPSFYVSPAKGVCKCFACGKGGNAVHFVMEHEQMSFPEALKYLARKYGIEVVEKELTDEEKAVQSERESLFIVNSFARDYFKNILHNHIDGQSIGMAYFRSRGFRDDTIEKFQLGYCTDQHDAMAKAALQKGYKKEYLVKTGICYEKDNGELRDRFWGRVIFPIHSLSGKVIAFGGRVLSSATKGVKVKYVNSPESEIYHKSNELYGIYFAKQAIVKQDRCFLVEGYTDVISMYQSGVENVVSSSGTALTKGQIRLIHRFTNNITVLYDGDIAGIKASLRGIDLLLEEGMNVKVCLLPDGDDPDSFARKHTAAQFQDFIAENETDFIRFKTKTLMDDAGDDPIKRAGLIKDIVESIAIIPEAIVRDVYIKETAQLLDLEDKLLVGEVARNREACLKRERERIEREKAAARREKESKESGEPVPQPAEEEPQPENSDNYTSYIPQIGKEGDEFYKYERLILQMIVRYGEQIMCSVENDNGETAPMNVIEYVITDLSRDDLTFHNPLHRTMLKEAAQHVHDEGFVAEHFFTKHIDPAISKLAVELVSNRYELSKYHTKGQQITPEKERLHTIVPFLVMNFKYAIVSEEIKHMMSALQNPEIAKDNEKCGKIMTSCYELQQIKSKMAQRLGDRVVIGL